MFKYYLNYKQAKIISIAVLQQFKLVYWSLTISLQCEQLNNTHSFPSSRCICCALSWSFVFLIEFLITHQKKKKRNWGAPGRKCQKQIIFSKNVWIFFATTNFHMISNLIYIKDNKGCQRKAWLADSTLHPSDYNICMSKKMLQTQHISHTKKKGKGKINYMCAKSFLCIQGSTKVWLGQTADHI